MAKSSFQLKMRIFDDVMCLFWSFCCPQPRTYDTVVHLLPKEGATSSRSNQEKQARPSVFLENLVVVITLYQFRFGRMMQQNRECSLRAFPPFLSYRGSEVQARKLDLAILPTILLYVSRRSEGWATAFLSSTPAKRATLEEASSTREKNTLRYTPDHELRRNTDVRRPMTVHH